MFFVHHVPGTVPDVPFLCIPAKQSFRRVAGLFPFRIDVAGDIREDLLLPLCHNVQPCVNCLLVFHDHLPRLTDRLFRPVQSLLPYPGKARKVTHEKIICLLILAELFSVSIESMLMVILVLVLFMAS